jgi:hypothetical protein
MSHGASFLKALKRDREYLKMHLEKPCRDEVKTILQRDLAAVERRIVEVQGAISPELLVEG